jgi:ABC-2 type transport system permease protein
MNTSSNAAPDSSFEPQAIAPAAISATRPMYWSIRRELWENRSLYIAPLAAGIVYMLGFLISLIWLPKRIRALPALDRAHQLIALASPYSHAAMLLTVTAFLVGIFYCLDTLHSERRDRSILFWKSLPVSDFTTVLSKVSIPLMVLPLLVFTITVTVQLIMRLLSTAVLLMSDVSPATLWKQLPLFEMELVLLYGQAVLVLWYAPLYAWLLLVSGWARRATFLWAVLPPFVIGVFERVAFHTSYFGSMLRDRLVGFAASAFDLRARVGQPVDPHFIPLTRLTPGRFLSSPGLWIGLAVAAIFLTAAVRLRRYREPI